MKTESQKSPVATSQQADAITPPFFLCQMCEFGDKQLLLQSTTTMRISEGTKHPAHRFTQVTLQMDAGAAEASIWSPSMGDTCRFL